MVGTKAAGKSAEREWGLGPTWKTKWPRRGWIKANAKVEGSWIQAL